MLKPGTLVEGYFIVDTLGEGGMGCVYLARNSANRPVALKEIGFQVVGAGEKEAATRQFLQELQVLRTLKHERLVGFVDAFSLESSHFLVMEYIQGQTLTRAVEDRPGFVPLTTFYAWARQLCETLAYLHSREPAVLFRDFKPSNVMVTEGGDIKLIDFGISREMGVDSKTMTLLQGFGSPGYAPIEQYGQGGTDTRADIYSLGATLYFILTRTAPPPSVTLLSGDDVLPAIGSINPQVGPVLDAVIRKMMGLRRDARFQSIEIAAQALREAELSAAGGHHEATEDLGPVPADLQPEALVGAEPTVSMDEGKTGGRRKKVAVLAATALMIGLGASGQLPGLSKSARPLPEIAGAIHLSPKSSPGLTAYLIDPPAGRPLLLDAGEYVLGQEVRITRPVTLIGSAVDGCRILGRGEGAVITCVSPLLSVSNITFQFQGSRWGQCVRVESGQASFEHCVFRGAKRLNQTMGGSGLRCSSCAVIVKDCLSEGNDKNGFQAENCTIDLTAMTCRTNGAHGICLLKNTQGRIDGSTAQDNGGQGIELESSKTLLISNTSCLRNKGYGVAFRVPQKGQLSACILKDNAMGDLTEMPGVLR